MMSSRASLALCAVLLSAAALPATAESVGQAASEAAIKTGHAVAEAGRTVGHAAAETGRAVGHGAAEAGRAVGHGAAEAGRATGHAAAKAGRATGHAAAEAGRATGHAAAEAGSKDRRGGQDHHPQGQGCGQGRIRAPLKTSAERAAGAAWLSAARRAPVPRRTS